MKKLTGNRSQLVAGCAAIVTIGCYIAKIVWHIEIPFEIKEAAGVVAVSAYSYFMASKLQRGVK